MNWQTALGIGHARAGPCGIDQRQVARHQAGKNGVKLSALAQMAHRRMPQAPETTRSYRRVSFQNLGDYEHLPTKLVVGVRSLISMT
jgi:hypothetical protein